MDDSGASAFFAEVSNQYQNDPNVLYEICNEPNYVDWATVKRYADGIINTIRANDPNGLILVGTPTWSQEIDKPASNPVAKAFNVMYVFIDDFAARNATVMKSVCERISYQEPSGKAAEWASWLKHELKSSPIQ
ncbi:Endoglucanase Z [Diplonema papillatum]|nr:Endoglucanase Z [Diplonema papillatum]